MSGPDDFAVGVGEFLGRAEVIELVVVGFGFFWAVAFEEGQWAEAVGFVEIAAVAICLVFGN